jgi:hypothetical protein
MTLRDNQRTGLWEKDRVSTGRLADARKVPSHGSEGPERKLFRNPGDGYERRGIWSGHKQHFADERQEIGEEEKGTQISRW